MNWPQLREELQLLPGPSLPDGQPSWTLHDPVRNLFFRIDWLSFEILSRWSLQDPEVICESIRHGSTLQPSAQEVHTMMRFMKDNLLIQPTSRETASQFAQKLQTIEGTPLQWLLHHYLFFRVPLWRPDAWLERWRPIADLFYTRTFAALTLLTFLLGLGLVLRQWDTFVVSLVDTFNPSGLMAYAVALFFVKLAHELGHAFVAKRHGCHIPTMGIAFLVMWPMAYTDTNDTWRLSDARQRLKVASAGIATELVIAAWASLAWALLPEGGLKSASFVLATTSWIATIAINASPFLRFDGYFILCDWLDMPNLHARSFALARWKLREWLFSLGEPQPEYFTERKTRGLILFAWATWIYRLVVFLGIALLVYGFFFKALGIVLAVVELVWFIGLPLWREVRVWRERWPHIREQKASRRRSLRTALILVLVILSMVIPLPGRLSASAVLRPLDIWPVFTPVAAQLTELTRQPESIEAGDRLATLSSPILQNRSDVLKVRLEQLQRQAAFSSLAPETRNRMQVHLEEWATATAEVASLDQERDRLLPRAPFSGHLRDIDPDLQTGQWFPAQHKLAVLVGYETMVVETYLDEASIRHIKIGDTGVFMTDGLEGPTVQVRLAHVDADATRVLPNGLLSAAAGGHILTRFSEGQHVPEAAVYRVVLELQSEAGNLSGQSWRGRLVIRSQARALAPQYLRQAIGVILRETGF